MNNTYQAQGEKVIAYLEMAKEHCKFFPKCKIEVIPRSKNSNVYALTKLASKKNTELLEVVSIEFLVESNIS